MGLYRKRISIFAWIWVMSKFLNGEKSEIKLSYKFQEIFSGRLFKICFYANVLKPHAIFWVANSVGVIL